MNDKHPDDKAGWGEEIWVAGNELVDRIRELVAEGNVRHLFIRKSDEEEHPRRPER